MDKKYTSFSFEDYLQDDYFIQSVLFPTEASLSFWQKQIQEENLDVSAFEEAKSFILKMDYASNVSVSQEMLDALWIRIQQTNRRRHQRKLFFRYAAAACLLTLVFGGWWFQLQNRKGQDTLMANVDRYFAESLDSVKDVQLISSDHKVELQGKAPIIDYTSNGRITINHKIVQALAQNSKKELPVYNQLLVPYGKRSFLLLSDGSKIWVNAGSRIVYPTEFKGSKREIYVDGEVYGEIFHDPEHPFVLKTKNMDVTVLGTVLDVSAYEKENRTSVVLCEGSVMAKNKSGEGIIMTPNQQLSYTNGAFQVKTVDVFNYTSWINGCYLFKHESFGVIIERLARFYGVAISCPSSIYYLKCSGSLELKDDLSKLINGLCETVPVACDSENGSYRFYSK